MKRHTRSQVVEARERVIRTRQKFYDNYYLRTYCREQTYLSLGKTYYRVNNSRKANSPNRFAKFKPLSCGKPRCYMCHGSKLMGETTRKAWAARANEQDMINELYTEQEVKLHRLPLGDPWAWD